MSSHVWLADFRDYFDKWRAQRAGAYAEAVDRGAIFERDGGMCQICKKPVRLDREFPHPLSPSLDHILPISKGGTHEPRNVQLTHWICNHRKGNRGHVQLRLLE